jgi:hypothetical protein
MILDYSVSRKRNGQKPSRQGAQCIEVKFAEEFPTETSSEH